MNGVNFRWAVGKGSQLIDMNPGSSGGKDDHSLTIGRTFSDLGNNFHVTPMRKGNTYPESIPRDQRRPLPCQPTACCRGERQHPGCGHRAVDYLHRHRHGSGRRRARLLLGLLGDGDYSVDNSATTTHSFAAAGEYSSKSPSAT